MKGSFFRLALVAIFLQLSCNAALAVTWFDSNIRPDGACDSNTNANASTYVAPADDSGSQTVSSNSADTGVEVVGAPDVYDSGD